MLLKLVLVRVHGRPQATFSHKTAEGAVSKETVSKEMASQEIVAELVISVVVFSS